VHNSGRIYVFNFGISAGISDFGISDLAGITDYGFRILANLKYFGFGAILTYDSVSRFLIIKALECLRIPETFINLMKNIFYNKMNKVIVNDYYIDFYEVGDGLDQCWVIR
jgi:hypothetical protein